MTRYAACLSAQSHQMLTTVQLSIRGRVRRYRNRRTRIRQSLSFPTFLFSCFLIPFVQYEDLKCSCCKMGITSMRELLEHRACEEDDQLLYPPEEPLPTTWESPPSSAFSSPTSSSFSSPSYSPYASPSPSFGTAMAMPVPSKPLSHIPDMLARMGRGRTNTPPPRLAIPQFNVSSLLLPAFNPTRKRKSESDHSPRDPIRLKRAKRVEDRERSFACPVGSSIYRCISSTDDVCD